MCGIAGAYRKPTGSLPTRQQRDETLAILAHRGPEAAGSWEDAHHQVWLGHRRLAIIDIDERSNQPYTQEGYTITFNGEIYNYQELQQELRAKGYTLATNSDTEVILLLYKEYGVEALKKLRGMFAFAIFNHTNGELFCVRDRIGEKPFLYSATDKGFSFASETPALHAIGYIEKRVETNSPWERLYDLTAFRKVPEPFSPWKDIQKLAPASWLIVRDGVISERGTYWQPVLTENPAITPRMVREKVVEAIALTSVADVPISVLLSGGIDSTIIAAVLTRELGHTVTGYAFGRDEHDPEIIRARDVAQEYGIPLKEFYMADHDIKEELKSLIRTYGEPVYLQPAAYASILFHAIRTDGMKVVLGGNGADEIFYGYTSHARTRTISDILRLCGIHNTWPLKKRRLAGGDRQTAEALEMVYHHIRHIMQGAERRSLLDLSSLFALLIENSHSITWLADSVAMQHSVEMRSPFLDYQLVELAMQIPMHKKVPHRMDTKGHYTKWILREAFADLIPERILKRKKMGFGYSISEENVFGPGGNQAFAAWSKAYWRHITQ